MIEQFKRHVFSFVVLVLWLTFLIHCMDDGATGSVLTTGHDQSQISAFVEKYLFRDPYYGGPISDDAYRFYAEVASRELPARKFYSEEFIRLRTIATNRLRQLHHIKTPDDLRQHPRYADYFDGRSHTPTIFMPVAKVLTRNPMGPMNPDVAVFMHSVRVSHLTHAQYWLELNHIVRGPTQAEQGEQVVWRRFRRDGFMFLDELPEPYKWPVLPDLERLGYDPRTITDEVILHNQATEDSSVYQNMPKTRLDTLIKHSRLYFSQFDSLGGDRSLNRYVLMLAPIDNQVQPEPWFQTPLFAEFGLGDRVQLLQYTRRDRNAASLDRLMYKAIVAPSGKLVLKPMAIVRPVRVIPALQFKTVYIVPAKAQKQFQFTHFTPSLHRLYTDPVPSVNPTESVSTALLFGRPRPQGHPLSLLESDEEASILADPNIPETQAFNPKSEPDELQPALPSHASPLVTPPANPRHQNRFAYMPGQPNPYERSQEDAMDVLMAHFKPKLEDMWRYPKP